MGNIWRLGYLQSDPGSIGLVTSAFLGVSGCTTFSVTSAFEPGLLGLGLGIGLGLGLGLGLWLGLEIGLESKG
jgi:hypothetical protein